MLNEQYPREIFKNSRPLFPTLIDPKVVPKATNGSYKGIKVRMRQGNYGKMETQAKTKKNPRSKVQAS